MRGNKWKLEIYFNSASELCRVRVQLRFQIRTYINMAVCQVISVCSIIHC